MQIFNKNFQDILLVFMLLFVVSNSTYANSNSCQNLLSTSNSSVPKLNRENLEILLRDLEKPVLPRVKEFLRAFADLGLLDFDEASRIFNVIKKQHRSLNYIDIDGFTERLERYARYDGRNRNFSEAVNRLYKSVWQIGVITDIQIALEKDPNEQLNTQQLKNLYDLLIKIQNGEIAANSILLKTNLIFDLPLPKLIQNFRALGYPDLLAILKTVKAVYYIYRP